MGILENHDDDAETEGLKVLAKVLGGKNQN